jgi:hypothetical protein
LAPPPALDHGAREPHFGTEPAFLGSNGGDAREEAPAPEPLAGRAREPLVALSAEDAARDEAEAEPEATGSLAKLLSARKARRRGARGRRTGSLSERLKNLSAESPDS